VAMEGCAGVMGIRGARTAGHLRDEKLDDVIDLEIEKVRRTTCPADFSEGSLCCLTPWECLQATDRPWQ
jgi:hypothetical protein